MQEPHSFLRRWVFSSSALLFVGLLVAAFFLILLANQHRGLRYRFERLGESLRSPVPGLWFPAVETNSIQGDTVCIGAPEGVPQLILFFTTTCEGCPEAFEDLSPLIDRLDQDGSAEVVAVAFDDWESTSSFTKDYDIGVPVAVLEHPRWHDVFRIGKWPQLVVLTSEGRVSVARSGPFSPYLLTDSVLPLIQRLQQSPEGSSDFSETRPTCAIAEVIRSREGGLQ